MRSRADTTPRAGRVFSDAHNGMLIVSPRGLILDANSAFCRATGYHPAEVRGRTPTRLKLTAHGPHFFAHLRHSLRKSGVWQGELVKRCKDGSLVTAFLTVSSVRNRIGQISHYLCVFSDIEPLKARQRRLEQLAYFDSLTGLPSTVADIQAVLDRILLSLSQVPLASGRKGISASVGVTLFPHGRRQPRHPPSARRQCDVPGQARRSCRLLLLLIAYGRLQAPRSASRTPFKPLTGGGPKGQPCGHISSLPVARRSARAFRASPVSSMA